MARAETGKRVRWRLWVNLTLGLVALAALYYTVRRVRQFAIHEARFTLAGPDERGGGLTMEGLHYSSRARVLATFAPDYGRSVYLIPLAERRRRLLAVDWVDDAAISRIWPNRVVVRIKERRPVAFVYLPLTDGRGSRVMLIDADGVLLEPPAQSKFSFAVLKGVTEEQTEAERRQRVRAMLRLLEDLGASGKSVSEVDAGAPENLRIVMTIEDRAVELVMGNQNFAARLESFLTHYPEIRRRSPELRAFDLRLDDRITAENTTR